MRSRVFRRRAVAAIGMYSAAVLGVAGTILAARQLEVRQFGLLTIVLAAAGFLQSLLDLTIEEALIKFGFRYSVAEDWGRLHRLVRRALVVKLGGALVAGLLLLVVAPFSAALWGAHGLVWPLVVASLLPLAQAPEAIGSVALVLRGRYDVRGGFLALSAGLRLCALAVGSRFGVLEAVVGVVVAQAVATAAISVAGLAALRRFPAARPAPLGGDARDIRRFVAQSSVATTILSFRSIFGPIALGLVAVPAQVGYFRSALAPQTALATLSGPARLILVTDQTRSWEHGERRALFSGVARYTLGMAAFAVVAVPLLLWLMPDLIRIFYGSGYLPATDAARLVLLAAAVQLLVGWSKSVPVSIGRPGLRTATHALEVGVFVPLVLVLGHLYGATGAGLAVLVSSAVFAAVWGGLILRLREALVERQAPPLEPLEHV